MFCKQSFLSLKDKKKFNSNLEMKEILLNNYNKYFLAVILFL